MTLSPSAGSGGRQATMREFLAVVFRRRGLIVGLFAVVTVTVVVLALMTPLTYSSSGKVLVLRGERTSALSPMRYVVNDWEEDLASEVAAAHSAPVIELTRGLLRDRAAQARKAVVPFSPASIDIEVVGKSNVVAIGYNDRNARVAHDVCDALLTAYLDYRQNGQRVGTADPFFNRQIDSLGALVQQKMSRREAISASSGVSNPIDQSRDLSQQISGLESRRNEAAADLATAQSELRTMRELQKHPDIDLPTMGSSFTNESALEILKTRVTDQQARVAQLRERYRDDAPEVQNAMQTLETLQALLRKEVEARLSLAQARIENLQAKVTVYDHDLADLHARQEAFPRSQRALDDLDAEIRALRLRLDEYAKARDQVQITSHTTRDVNVVLLNPAGPALPKNARDYVRLALAPAFSLVVGVGLAFFFDGLDLTVRTPGQAEEYLEMPVLASLPDRRRKRG